MVDWDSVSREKAMFLRRSLGQLRSRVLARIDILENGLPTMDLKEIDEAEDCLNVAMLRYSVQYRQYETVAQTEDGDTVAIQYFNMGRQAKFILEASEQQKGYLEEQNQKREIVVEKVHAL
jgi:hypothetical protein